MYIDPFFLCVPALEKTKVEIVVLGLSPPSLFPSHKGARRYMRRYSMLSSDLEVVFFSSVTVTHRRHPSVSLLAAALATCQRSIIYSYHLLLSLITFTFTFSGVEPCVVLVTAGGPAGRPGASYYFYVFDYSGELQPNLT